MLKLDFTNEVGVDVEEGLFVDLVARFEEVMGEREGLLDSRFAQYSSLLTATAHGLLELILVDDEKIAQINGDYRGKEGPTDVISFAYLEAGEGEIVGDIFISVDTAKRQAEEKGHSLERELAILFVHGLLHCFGFDHNNDEEEAEMEGWAEKVLD